MLRYFVSFFILIAFSTSAVGCSLVQLVNKNAQCSVELANCSAQPTSSSSQDTDSNHHHFCCTHITSLDEKPLVFSFFAFDELANDLYSFLYKNPTLDTLKRPPLTA